MVRKVLLLLRGKELWQDRTGVDPSGNETMEIIFRGSVESSLSPTVQAALKAVVGLQSMPYAIWAAHIIQYRDNEFEEQEQEKEFFFTSVQFT